MYEVTKIFICSATINNGKTPILRQDNLIVFNVAECEKVFDLVSDSTLQIASKKIPLVQF